MELVDIAKKCFRNATKTEQWTANMIFIGIIIIIIIGSSSCKRATTQEQLEWQPRRWDGYSWKQNHLIHSSLTVAADTMGRVLCT